MAKASLEKFSQSMWVNVYFIFFSFLLLMAYPALLFYLPGISPDSQPLTYLGFDVSAGEVSHPFGFRVPVEYLVGYSAFVILLFQKFYPNHLKSAPFVIALFYIAFCTLSYQSNASLPEEFLEKASYILVPLALALLIVKQGYFDTSRFHLIGSCLFVTWLLMAFFSFCSDAPIGLSGNTNWFITAFLSLSPWAICFLFKFFKKFGISFLLSSSISFLLVGGVSLYWLWRSESRGAYVAIVAYFLIMVLRQFKRSKAIKIFFALVTLSLVFLFLSVNYLKSAYSADIRGPLYKSTLNMIMDKPIAGFGAGTFEKEYPNFKDIAHSQRAVAALATEHPHNEFLYLSAEMGLPVAILWLTFCGLLLFVRLDSSEGHFAYWGYVLLFVHGFFDKGLISPPCQLLFWLFSAFLLSSYLRGQNFNFSHTKRMKLILALMSFLFFLPFAYRFKDIVGSRLLCREAQILEKEIAGVQSRESYREKNELLYSLYDRAFEADPTSVLPSYMALHIALENLQNSSYSALQLERVLNLDENFQHVNYFAGLYNIRKWQQEKDPVLKSSYLESSLLYFSRELKRHPYRFSSMNHIIEALTRNLLFREAQQALEAQEEAIKVFHESSFVERDKALTLSRNWHSAVISKNAAAVNIAALLLKGFDGLNFYDFHLPSLATPGGFLEKHPQQIFHNTDLIYWAEALFMMKESSESYLAWEAKVLKEMTLNEELSFMTPAEVMKAKEVSDLSLVSALNYGARSRGHLSFLIKLKSGAKDTWLLAVFDGHKTRVLDVRSLKAWEGNIHAWLRDYNAVKSFVGYPVSELGIYLFEYPQAFSTRNVFLSKVLSSNVSDIKDFCSPPSFEALKLYTFLRGQYPVHFLREPFVKFERTIER